MHCYLKITIFPLCLLSEFGHFGTSIVKPLELEIEVDASPDSKNLIPHMTIEVPEEELGFEKELENEKVVEKVEGQNLNQIKVFWFYLCF